MRYEAIDNEKGEFVQLDWYHVLQLQQVDTFDIDLVDVSDKDQLIMDLQWQVNFDRPLWIQGYHVTRHYGGGEEGGWWYNWVTESDDMRVRMPNEWLKKGTYESVHKVRRHFLKMWERKYGYGDIYSMSGGEDVTAYIEYGDHGQHQSTELPHYE